MEQKRTAQPSWEDLEALVLIGRHGSMRSAAEHAGVAHTTLAKRVSAAEKALGIVAFVRGPSGFAPTDAGQIAIAHAERMAHEADELSRRVRGTDTRVAGSIRISLVATLLTHLVASYIQEFAGLHPDIRLNLVTDDGFSDLDRNVADIAIRFQDTPREDLFGRRVAEARASIYAGANFDRTLLDSREPVPAIGWSTSVSVHNAYAALGLPHVDVRWAAKDIHAQVALALAGTAVVQLPCFVGDVEPGLVRVHPDRTSRIRDVWVLTHNSLKGSRRVRETMRFLGDSLMQDRTRLAGSLTINR